jgi:hypothetical protein
MSKISYPQLVKNIADAYRSATNTTDPIVVGELTEKLTEAMNNSGGDCDEIAYKSITYNEDDTITLIDSEDIEHTMECTYVDGILTKITYDGQTTSIQYEDGALVKIGSTAIDLNNFGI